MPSFKVLLREDKLRSNGEAPLYLRITHARRSSYLHTDIWLTPTFWNKDRNSVRRTHPNYKRLNDDLRRQLTEVQSAYLSLKSQGKRISAKAIKASVKGSGEADFFDYADSYAESWEQKSIWEYKKIRVLLNKIRAFWKRKDLAFADIDRDFLEGLVLHMRDECQNKKSTQQKNLQILKSIIKRAVMEGVISPPDDPFNYFKIGSSKGSREKLAVEKIHAMEQLNLPQGSTIDIARDLFVFSFYNYGMRFGDLIALRWESVVDGRLNYVMMKSSKSISVKLKDSALGILEKYRSLSSGRSSFIFPVLDPNRDYSDRNFLKKRISSKNARLNKELKSVATLVQTDVNVSFHVARHSFADFARSKGMPLYSISKALGHSSISTTEKYLKSMDQGAVDDLSDALFD